MTLDARNIHATALAALIVVFVLGNAGCHCGSIRDGSDAATESSVAADPGTEPAPDGTTKSSATNRRTDADDPPEPPNALVVTDPAQISADMDLGEVVELDLALSIADSHERPMATDESPRTQDACSGLDLAAIGRRAPKLQRLRVSGCQSAIHAGLAAFAPTLTELELADMTLDAMTIARVAQLERLRRLTLTRVRPGVESFAVLSRSVELTHLSLRDLERDSLLGDLLGDFRTLTHVELEGEWAGHRAMTSLAKAKRLESLTLTETEVGNFSLNQIRGLDRLHTVDWTGSTFNDNSPLHLRELPVERFRCACPRFGDGGLRHLRYLEQLSVLDLPQSQISSGGFVHLEKLPQLREVRVGYREISDESFAALAQLPELETLIIQGGELTDPEATHLGELVHLRHLELGLASFDDQAAPQLATLVELRHLDLGHTRISDDGLASLATLTRLEDLRLHHTQITNRGLANLAGLSSLRRLELDHTDVVDAGVSHLAGLENIEDLRLDSTLITDGALNHLSAMHGLERLNLANTVVTDEGVAKLRSLPSLTALNVENTRVTEQRSNAAP